MIFAFVRAEAYSARFGPIFRQVMGGKQAIYNRDLNDASANGARRRALAVVRGYGQNAYLFRGWPDDVRWTLVAVSVGELGGFLYANDPTWTTLTQESRIVRDGAANLETVSTHEGAKPNVLAVERGVLSGQTFEPLIAAATDQSAQHILVEGHARAPAYVRVLEPDQEIEVIVGYSAALAGWHYF
jgi:hypothetical protein